MAHLDEKNLLRQDQADYTPIRVAAERPSRYISSMRFGRYVLGALLLPSISCGEDNCTPVAS
jgi:hypothetical protein